MSNLKLTHISVYPIKSLGGISLSEAKVLKKGLQHDRRWMLVDNDGKFMSQRMYPIMARFAVAMNETTLTVTHQAQTLEIPITQHIASRAREVRIWGDTISAIEADEAYSSWFSRNIGVTCQLVYFPEENPRPVDPAYNLNDDHVSLADGYPFLIIGQSSLDMLNEKLAAPVPMNRFRPNFVFTGGTPHVEDSWRNLLIGEIPFAGVKPCERCVLTTVNQETGEKGDEPLRTLSTYRNNGKSILFGQNLIALRNGIVRVGDSISIGNS